jgi:ketosteroid isomerase-like protein
MNSQKNLLLAQQFLAKLGSNASAEEVASLCTEDLAWEVPGEAGALPWIGTRTGAAAMADFVRDAQRLLTREKLDVQDLLASDTRAVILGQLASRVNTTGRLIESQFAIVLTFTGEKVSSFLLLEDSFAVAAAARG